MLLCAFSANAQESVVAKIGNVEYTTFASAMAAANAATGNVDVEVYGAVEFVDGMELDGSYTAITFTGKSSGAQITINQTAGGDYLTAHGKTVAFNDLILAKANPAWSGNSGHMGNYFSIQGGTVTYTDCTFPNGACTSTGTAVYNNCTFQNASEYGLWVYDDALVTVNGGTIDSTKGIKVYSEGEESVTSTLTVQNATFTENVTAKPAVAIGYAESITLIGNTYNNTTGHVELDSGSDADCDGIAFVAEDSEGNDISSELTVVDRSNSSAACGVLVDGKIYTTVTTAAAEATSGSTVTLLYSTTETVELPEGVTLDTNGFTADNVTVVTSGVAQVGDTTYATLAEAVAAAQAGDEIKLLSNIEGDITVPANVTLNGNGYAISGGIFAEGDITFAGVTTAADFDANVANTAVNIPAGASLQLTGSARLVIGHGATFNITGTITDAKTADKATLVPSLKIAAGASITGNGVTFNVNNAYIVANANTTSKNSNANGTLDFNINNSIWEQTGVLAFYVPTSGKDPVVNFDLKNSVLTTTSHLVFSVTKGEIVFDNSLVNQGTSRQLENRSTMTIKNGSVVNGAVATSSNAINPGTLIVENATYAVTGEFSGSDLGTGTLIVKKGATVSAGSITKANIQIDATGMAAGDEVNLTANLSNLEGSLTVVNNNLDASIVDGKIVLAVKPVAKIGDVEYATLDEAFGAATEGATITLLADATPALTSQSAITKAAVIDLGGNTLTLTEDDLYFGTTTFKNGTIVVDPSVSASTAVFWMFANQTLTFDNVDIIATGLTGTYLIGINNGTGSSVNLLNGSSITIDNSEKAELSTVIADNGNGNSVIIKDSKIDVKNVDARLYLGGQNGSVTIENSDIVLNGVKEGFYLRAGQTLAINGTSKVDITLNADTKPRYGINMTDATATYTKAETATVNATVYAPATGSNSLAYTKEENGYVRVWGEGGGNAKESYELKLYSGETLIATTKLNNVGNIIDGDVYVTWNFYYPQSTDEYWTTTWEEGHPNSAAQPTEVELYIDGTLVATTAAKMSGADDVAPVVWRNLGGVAIANLLGEGTAENPYLIETLKDLKFFRDDVNTYTQDGSNQYKGKYVKLTADIDLAGENWEPIGKNSNGDHQNFLGTFYGEKADGTKPTISNLYINADGDHLGFFARVGSYAEGLTPTVKNIKFNNVDVSSNTTNSHSGSYVAGVIANAGGNSVVSGIEVTGDVYVVGYGYIGGIVGHGYPDIDNCHVAANDGSYIHSHYWCVGGIIGYAGEGGTPITNSSVSGVDIWSAYGAAAAIAGLLNDGNKLENVSASNVDITSNSDYCMGYIAGNGNASTMTGISIENVTATAKGNPITPTDAIAKVNDAIYFSLQDALDAAAAGTGNVTVTILRDVELTESLVIAAGKTITLDLNGKTVDVAWENEEDGKHIYALTNNGTLTVTGNGTINTRGIYNYGDMTLTSGTINAIDGNGGYGVLNYAGATFTMNGGTIATTLEDDNKVDKGGYDATPVRVDEGATFTMNGGVINNICDFTVAIDNYGTTIIKDGEATTVHTTLANHGTMTINGGEFTCNGIEGITAHALWAAAGETTINGGTFNGKDNYNGFNVDASEGAVVNITGGTFLAVHSGSLYGEGTITVSGGTFFDAVPADRCADGYVALPDLNGNYVVGVKPTATVNNLGMTTVAAGDYMVYGNGDNTADMPLSFVMQFLADQDAEDMTKSPFAEWYGDFVITFTGLENGSFTADGCYLAGHYGSFGWVKVPVDGMIIEEGARYPVMLGVGMGQKYDYICTGVKDFRCAMYLPESLLEANPNIQVKLELAVVDNSNGEDAAASALVNNDKVYSVAGYTYDAEDFVVKEYVAKIGETAYATLAEAVAAAEADETITLIADVELTETLNIPAGKTIALDLNGKTISQTKEQTAAYQMILNDGNLTINDSSEAKTGKISYTDSGNGGEYISDVIYNRSVLVINGGTIENLSSATVASNGYPHAVDTYSGIRDTYVEINGGTIYCAEYSAIRMFCVSATNKADLVINGGTIKGAIDMQNGTKNLALGTLTINDGTFETTKNANNIRFANWNGGATEYGISAEIKGGSFNGGITTAYVPAAANWDKGVITGGTFAKDMTEYCAEGFVCEANGDGTYGIVADPNYIAEFTIDDAARVDYVNDTDKTVGTLTYKRTLAEGAWNPLYLPFQVDVAQLADNYDIAYYNQMLSSDSNNDGAFDSYIMEVAYITSGTLKANYPYFIRPKTSDDCYLEYVANDVTLCAAKETVIVTSSVANTFKLHGTHKTVSAADLAGCYTIKASGWVQTTIDLRPHRLYLEILENDNSPFVPAAAKSIRIVVRGEDGYTGVEEITGENCEDMIFDLQGRRVLEPEKGGMYIINGKKVIY